MAIVRITDRLREHVSHNVKAVFRERIAETSDYNDKDWGDRIANVMLLPFERSLSNLHDDFKNTTEAIHVQNIFLSESSRQVELGVSLPLSRRYCWPNRITTSLLPYATLQSTYSSWLNLHALATDERWMAIIDDMVAWADARLAAVEDQSKAVEAVEAILSRHSSLAPALREYPPLWEVLPTWAKDQHKKIIKRDKVSEKSEGPPPVDTTALDNVTAQLALQRLTKDN